MPRNISFSMTTPQFIDGSKDVTRRMGWKFLKPGDVLCAVEKGMGLKKGEKVNRLGLIEVVSVRRESIGSIDWTDVKREGFPDMSPSGFVSFYCKANKCGPGDVCTRIEFKKIKSSESDDKCGKCAARLVEQETGPNPSWKCVRCGVIQ